MNTVPGYIESDLDVDLLPLEMKFSYHCLLQPWTWVWSVFMHWLPGPRCFVEALLQKHSVMMSETSSVLPLVACLIDPGLAIRLCAHVLLS